MGKKRSTRRAVAPDVSVQIVGQDVSIQDVLAKMFGSGMDVEMDWRCSYPDCEEMVSIDPNTGRGYCSNCHKIYCGYHRDFRIHGCQRDGK